MMSSAEGVEVSAAGSASDDCAWAGEATAPNAAMASAEMPQPARNLGNGNTGTLSEGSTRPPPAARCGGRCDTIEMARAGCGPVGCSPFRIPDYSRWPVWFNATLVYSRPEGERVCKTIANDRRLRALITAVQRADFGS